MEGKTIHAVPGSDESLIEVARSVRDLPPAHYRIKISSFSQLSQIITKGQLEKHESGDFEAGGYKWRLSLYPNGDKKKNGSDHISLYLVLAKTNILPLNLEINVFFKLFVYDQVRDTYLTIQDVNNKVTRFHALKTEWGFPRLLPLSTFNDAANGYLVEDCCTFGAEVFVANCTAKGESFSINKNPQLSSFSWKIDNFSCVKEEFILSDLFSAGGYQWRLLIYPKGESGANGKHLSLYCRLADGSILRPGQKIYAGFKLLAKDQVSGSDLEFTADNVRYSASSSSLGYANFLKTSDLQNKSKGFIVNDCLIVEVQFSFVSVIKDFE